jgi:thioredoxin 1
MADLTGTTNMTTLTDATFDEALASVDVPMLVDFWAAWCGPCIAMEPILEEIAVTNQGRLRIGKLNVDEHMHVPLRYDVMSFPTFMLFKDGEPVVRLVGARGKARLLAELDNHL